MNLSYPRLWSIIYIVVRLEPERRSSYIMNSQIPTLENGDIRVTDINVDEMTRLHEAKNPQLLYNQLNLLNQNAKIESIPHMGFSEMNNDIDIENDGYDYMEDDNVYEDQLEEDNNTEEMNNVNNILIYTQEYPKTQHISKESFQKFVHSLSTIKNLKQNVVFENGVTYFVSDSKSYICKFDIHCPEISFKIPFADQQASQLNFLTRSKNAVSVLETEDDYMFSDGQFKFQLRKSIPDQNTLSLEKFKAVIDRRITCPVIADYEFTDKNHLESFLSIIKGVKKSNIEFSSSNDNTELILNRGDINSGKFELLRIPCNIGATNNQKINTVLDSSCLLYDYKTLRITFYYNGVDANDSISVILSGTLNNDFDITFICTAYRNYISKSA